MAEPGGRRRYRRRGNTGPEQSEHNHITVTSRGHGRRCGGHVGHVQVENVLGGYSFSDDVTSTGRGRGHGNRGRRGGRGRGGQSHRGGHLGHVQVENVLGGYSFSDDVTSTGRGRGRGNRGGRGGRGRGGRRHGGQGHGGGGHPIDMRLLSDEDLQILSQGSPEEVYKAVSENEPKFLNSFKNRKYCDHRLRLKRLIKLLSLLVRYDEDPVTVSRMLAEVLSCNGEYVVFSTSITMLLSGMSMETQRSIKSENVSCIEHLVDIGLVAIKRIPSVVMLTYPVLNLEHAITELTEQEEKMDLVVRKSAELSMKFRLKKSEIQREKQLQKAKIQKRVARSANESEGDPPEPFTEVSILPKPEEMHVDPGKVFLRRNKVEGSYDSWDHYFDVQFRLLREDFVRPLRNGIFEFSYEGSQRPSDIRVYEGAKVLNPVCLFTGIAFQLRFDTTKLERVNWDHSRRLIFGSLLCLSNDNFKKCFLFASVQKRDSKLLKEGLVTVKFENGVNGFLIDPNETYTMVESTAYYEAYRHILEGLQQLSSNSSIVPMEKCIVKVSKDEIDIPAFLRVRTRPPHFNMADIFDISARDPSMLRRRLLQPSKVFDVTKQSSWPGVQYTHLDDSQLRALKLALTKEVAIIQGPPGTGKTYIGLKIVETYLKNRAVWDPQKAAPILVVCYTNHALDQFLEGIQALSIDDSKPDIIRVGGRCKSESLVDCTLNKRVQEQRNSHKIPRNVFKPYKEARDALFATKDYIVSSIESSDAGSEQKIMSLLVLESVIDPMLTDQLRYGAETVEGKEIEVFLGLWFPESQEKGDLQQPLSAAIAESAQPQFAPSPLPIDGASSSDEEDLIEVDNEARVLEDDRMIEGELIDLPETKNTSKKKKAKPASVQAKKANGKSGWTTVQLSANHRKRLVSRGLKNDPMTNKEVSRVTNIWTLNMRQKWKLYLHWTNAYIRLCKERINDKAATYNASCDVYHRSQQDMDCYAASGADIIGMTTTGAAKYHHLLHNVHPKIVIFEEAAEVLEAHVITSLASSVQQLILIGDHQQLRPKPTCYDLEKDYKLDVSLFERLIENDFDHVTLEIQHRMRPEVSKLICPIIYEKLLDADNVKKYDHVQGVGKDVFFIDHTQPEEPNRGSDTKSHVNKYEVEYTVELCHYLLKQGYKPQEITILTMYRGQLLEFRNQMKRKLFEGVRVAAVDDFQGEENEIILLSLVRSNSEKIIGFLSIENRVCVSLSRAKKGLYVIGNMAMLREKHQTKWPAILHHLESVKAVGSALPLYCQIHRDDKISAQVPADFSKRPEGGCTKVCGSRLPCGHACEKLCHPTDREHALTKCAKVCLKSLPCGHNCKKKCFQCKKLSGCAPCSEPVLKTLSPCGHTDTVPCSADPFSAPCKVPCEKMLACGHKCKSKCSEPCTPRCNEMVLKQLPCEHDVKVPCHMDPETFICTKRCTEVLECGDVCSGTCGKCRRGRLHVQCKKKCGRDLVCGHPCEYPCASICPPCEKICNNYCFHSHCPKKCYDLCQPCMEPCGWKCPHFECTKSCGQPCNRPPCDLPCDRILACGHPCIGLCGEICPDKCRVCNRKEVCEIFFGTEEEDGALFMQLQDCGHIFEVNGLDEWMRTDTSSNSSPLGSSQVQFKTCPKCKTPIRKSLRYGNIVKQTLKDVEAIKRKQIAIAVDMRMRYREAKRELLELSSDTSFIAEEFKRIEDNLSSKRSASNWYRAKAAEFQLSILPKLLKIYNIINKISPLFHASNFTPLSLQADLLELKSFLMQEFLSTQQISDSVSELRRLTCAAKLLDLLSKVQTKPVSTSNYRMISQALNQAYLSGWKNATTTESDERQVNDLIRTMSLKYNVDGLSKAEKLEIVQAIGLSKGHWYKCPRGHYYCIGECGRAMETSRCPECGRTIGGRNYELVAGNVRVGEMEPSQQANMLDEFDFAQLRLH